MKATRKSQDKINRHKDKDDIENIEKTGLDQPGLF